MRIKTTLFCLPVALSCLFFFTGCAVNPVTGKQNFTLMSEAGEIQKGQQAAAEISKEYGIYDSPALQSYVNEVGQKLAKNSHRSQLDFHFTVVDSPRVNAFALPGGYVYVTRGILAYLNSEAELAAVLGHEIGHVTARHSVQQYSAGTAANVAVTIGGLVAGIFVPQLGGALAQGIQSLLGITGSVLLSGYGRSHELEADRLGAQYLARSGYDPQAMIKIIGVLKNQELFDIEAAKQEGREPRRYHGLFATHPDNDRRLQEVVGEASQYIVPGVMDDRRAEFLRQMEGMVFGDAIDHGIIRQNAFFYKALGFTLTFPPGWRIRNQPDKVMAVSPESDAVMQLSLVESNSRNTPAEVAREHFRLGSGSEVLSATLNGLPAALVAATTRDGKPFKAAVIYHDNKAFLLAGAGDSPAAFDRHQAEIASAINSFRALSDAEKKSIKALEIKIITATRDSSYAGLAEESPLGANAESYLRLLNGQYPSGEPASGQMIKIVK